MRWPAVPLIVVAILAAPTPAVRAEVPGDTYVYAIHDPAFGRIGTFSVAVRRDGDLTVVADRAAIEVKALFVTLRSLRTEGVAIWSRGRLLRYDRKVVEDGAARTFRGWAEGERFLIDGPAGLQDAPADIVPANPWSVDFVHGRRFLSPITGKVYESTMSEGEARVIEHGGRLLPTSYHRSDATGEEVWYDAANVPVAFSLSGSDGAITFTLEAIEAGQEQRASAAPAAAPEAITAGPAPR